jgi:uncharacterized protein (TIGR02118 family)
MIKLTVLYGHPTDPVAFESYYANTHQPIVSKVKGFIKAELTKFMSAADGGKPAYYRMAELYFPSIEELQKTVESPEGKTLSADLANFATGGATIIIGSVD